MEFFSFVVIILGYTRLGYLEKQYSFVPYLLSSVLLMYLFAELISHCWNDVCEAIYYIFFTVHFSFCTEHIGGFSTASVQWVSNTLPKFRSEKH